MLLLIRILKELVAKVTLKFDFLYGLLKFVVRSRFFLKNLTAAWSRTLLVVLAEPHLNAFGAKEFIAFIAAATLGHVK